MTRGFERPWPIRNLPFPGPRISPDLAIAPSSSCCLLGTRSSERMSRFARERLPDEALPWPRSPRLSYNRGRGGGGGVGIPPSASAAGGATPAMWPDSIEDARPSGRGPVRTNPEALDRLLARHRGRASGGWSSCGSTAAWDGGWTRSDVVQGGAPQGEPEAPRLPPQPGDALPPLAPPDRPRPT